MSKTKIEWTDHSLNPGIYGCSPAGEGCRNCYAEKMAFRLGEMGQAAYQRAVNNHAKWSGPVRTDPDQIHRAFAKLPKRKPARVFVSSMGDLFHEDVPDEFIRSVFREMVARPHLTFKLLTKRPKRMASFGQNLDFWMKGDGQGWTQNIWAGCSCSTVSDVHRTAKYILRTPAAVRFISFEPLLEDISIPAGIDWAIVGCESGPKRRPCREEWIRSIVERCRCNSVPVFVKQIEIDGRVSKDPGEWPEDLRVQEFPG